MSLANKIKISFMVIIILPIGLIMMSVISIGRYHIDVIEETYDIKIEDTSNIFDETKILDVMTESIRVKIQNAVEENNMSVENKELWESFTDIKSKNMVEIIVYYGNDCVYNSLGNKDNNIAGMLPKYDSISDISVATYYVGESEKYLVKPVPFTYKDGTFGTVYVIGKIGETIPEISNLGVRLVFMCIILMTGVGAGLTIWLYKSVLKPIVRLKNAAIKISNGDLESSIVSTSTDEFGQLYDAFEDMRVHLKDSIEDNLKKDVESKELISNISHDLKTPITAIKGYVEGIMDGVADSPEKMERYIKTIYNKANDMDRLIGELTVYSQIDTNRIPYHFVKLNVEEYFKDCIAEISTELENKGFKLTFLNYIDKSAEVIADPEQIKRVINNIVSNSLKYNDKEVGVINIRIKDQKDYVHFEIEDNGRGVAPSDLPYIFERFYRTDTSRNTKKGGSGIGLSIVRKIIEAHGGTIWAFSTLGTGLSIHFILKKVGDETEKEPEECIKPEKKAIGLRSKK